MIGRRYHGDMFLLGYGQLEGGGDGEGGECSTGES